MEILRDLRVGDLLLYRPSTLFGWVIAVKTWARFSHVEVYIGNDHVFAARTTGVNRYNLRTDHLGAVLRPFCSPDMDRASAWFYSVAQGQKYDYLGLLCFTLAVRQGDPKKMFCSECVTRLFRNGGIDLVARHWDADRVAPANLLMIPLLELVWSDGKLL